MTRLEELRTQCRAAYSVPGIYLDGLIIDKSDLRALLDVAEAAHRQWIDYCGGLTDDCIDGDVQDALAPLVKEATDD